MNAQCTSKIRQGRCTEMQRYIGVDYHKGYSYMTVMDETGKICGQGQVSNRPEEIRDFLTRFGVNGNGAAVLEATCN